MIYNESLPTLSKSTVNVSVGSFTNGINTKLDQNVLLLNYAVNSYNFSISSGALRDGMGLGTLTIPLEDGITKTFVVPSAVTEIKNVWHYRRYDRTDKVFKPMLVICAQNGKLYYGRLDNIDNNLLELSNLTFNATPTAINYRIQNVDCLLLCSPSESDHFTVWDGVNVAYQYPNAPVITSACIYAGRLFVTTGGDKSQLWYSDDLDPRNWNVGQFEGGYIEMTDERGTLNKLIESNNYLYIIREYGISRLSAWGEQTDFTIRHLYLSTGKIYANSTALCGSDIIMLCNDGLYLFDGADVKKICSGLDGYFDGIDNTSACATFLNGKYYLACRLNFNDNETIGCESSNTYVNNALIEYDINTGFVNIMRGVDISTLSAFQTSLFSKLVVVTNDTNANKLYELTTNGAISNSATTKNWTSPFSDLGYPLKTKVLKKFTINTATNIQLIIKTENTTYTYNIKGANYPVSILLDIKCKKFSFAIKSTNNNCNISNAQLQVYLV